MGSIFWLLVAVISLIGVVEWFRIYHAALRFEQEMRARDEADSAWRKVEQLLFKVWEEDRAMAKKKPFERVWRKKGGTSDLELEISGTWKDPDRLILVAWNRDGDQDELWSAEVSIDFDEPEALVFFLRKNLEDRIQRVLSGANATRTTEPSGPESEAA